MRSLFLLFVAACWTITLPAFAQTNNDCDQLRAEVDYLRNALKMQSNPVFTDVVMGVELKIVSVVGSKRTKTVQVNALFTSQRTDKSGSFYYYHYVLDPEGNEYKVGCCEPMALSSDIPRSMFLTFDNISPDIPMFRIMKLNIYVDGQQKVVEYRNVKIDWK
ncbi:hypothetical protein [Rudanella lutea]|jgi:hypothetical protein|uniref:hypothetical protein n=1 Tax=Rudanella lutea TaxID=451374 RepID=UPI000360D925|nr:hypothetical protein [Rudanella lutea]